MLLTWGFINSVVYTVTEITKYIQYAYQVINIPNRNDKAIQKMIPFTVETVK